MTNEELHYFLRFETCLMMGAVPIHVPRGKAWGSWDMSKAVRATKAKDITHMRFTTNGPYLESAIWKPWEDRNDLAIMIDTMMPHGRAYIVIDTTMPHGRAYELELEAMREAWAASLTNPMVAFERVVRVYMQTQAKDAPYEPRLAELVAQNKSALIPLMDAVMRQRGVVREPSKTPLV